MGHPSERAWLPGFVEGLILHEDGRYAEALPAFERALAALRSRTLGMAELAVRAEAARRFGEPSR